MVNYIKISVLLLFIVNCSSFQLSKHNGFWEWFIGKPGALNAAYIPDDPIDVIILEERHPFYLWFRTPEVILNPDSFKVYDNYSECTNYFYRCEGAMDTSKRQHCNRPICCKGTAWSTTASVSAISGIIDFFGFFIIITKDNLFTNKEEVTKDCISLCGLAGLTIPYIFTYNLLGNFIKTIIYIPHDIIKTALVPIAGGYYTIKAIQGENNDKSESGKKFPVTNHQILTTSIKKEIK